MPKNLFFYVSLLFTYHTVGAQSKAHVRQNLVNCRGNITGHRRRRKLRFFFIRKILGWRVNIEVLRYVKILKKLLLEKKLNWHIKQMYILRGKMPIKSLKKIKLRK
jgi:hypothetical protein